MKHKKNIAVIGTVGLPAKYGGFETLAEYLVKHLARKHNMTVYCSGQSYHYKPSTYKNANLKYINLKANGIQSIPYDIISIFKANRTSEVLLILGVSGCIILPFLKLFSKKKIIVHIDGLEWKRDKWSNYAKWFLKFSEKLAVKTADIIISDNKVIQDYVKKKYKKNSELIAYGSDHCNNEEMTKKMISENPFLNEKYALKVSRIEPENNIHTVLNAFSRIENLNLVVIGNWNNSNYGKKLKLKFESYKNIHLMEPIYDQNILNQIRSNCYIYIHGHGAGGTNPSLVEAMYLNLPIIAFGINYNIETTGNKAKYFNNENDLINIINKITLKEVNSIAINLKEIASTKYTWKIISEKYDKLFCNI
ncbi:MAG: glycosyl transferase [Crocinitomicaceae bacterium]|nr:glycosyl transferase [Crocinitomicaceae bacterium]|tara:strand:+ start:26893 stop:27984 length:1092 start_codon:yes stop_codon:yes gene_type:complete